MSRFFIRMHHLLFLGSYRQKPLAFCKERNLLTASRRRGGPSKRRTTHSRIMIQSAVMRASGAGHHEHIEARTTHNRIMIQSAVMRASGAGAPRAAHREQRIEAYRSAHHTQPDHDPVSSGARVGSRASRAYRSAHHPQLDHDPVSSGAGIGSRASRAGSAQNGAFRFVLVKLCVPIPDSYPTRLCQARLMVSLMFSSDQAMSPRRAGFRRKLLMCPSGLSALFVGSKVIK